MKQIAVSTAMFLTAAVLFVACGSAVDLPPAGGDSYDKIPWEDRKIVDLEGEVLYATPRWRLDGEQAVVLAQLRTPNKAILYINDRKVAEADSIMGPIFTPDQKHTAWYCVDGGKPIKVYMDEKEIGSIPAGEQVRGFYFNDSGSRLGYFTQKGSEVRWKVLKTGLK